METMGIAYKNTAPVVRILETNKPAGSALRFCYEHDSDHRHRFLPLVLLFACERKPISDTQKKSKVTSGYRQKPTVQIDSALWNEADGFVAFYYTKSRDKTAATCEKPFEKTEH